MLNKIFTALLLISGLQFCNNKLQAQEVIYSTYDKYDARNGDHAVVGKVGDQLFTYRADKDGYYLDSWDDKMNKVATIILDFFPLKIQETQFIVYSDKIIVLYHANERGTVNQYAAKLDGRGLLQAPPLKIVSEKSGFFGSNTNFFSVAISDDKNGIAIYNTKSKSSNLIISGKIFDSDLKLKRQFSSEYKGEKDQTTGSVLLSNSGTLYLTAYSGVGNKDYADKVMLLQLKSHENQFTASSLSLNGKFAASSYMKMDASNEKIYLVGFYSENRSGNFDGVFYAQYDVITNSYTNNKLLSFSLALRNQTGTTRISKAFNNYQVKDLIVMNDGGFVLLSESYFMSIRSSGYMPGYYSYYYMSPMTATTNIREYNYGDILALSYSAEGALNWSTFIRKQQYSQEDNGMFSSYGFFNTGGSLGFLYNDYARNRSSIQLATIDGNGKLSTGSMAVGSVDDPDWIPRAGKQVAAREWVVPCLRKKQVCFAKIIY